MIFVSIIDFAFSFNKRKIKVSTNYEGRFEKF